MINVHREEPSEKIEAFRSIEAFWMFAGKKENEKLINKERKKERKKERLDWMEKKKNCKVLRNAKRNTEVWGGAELGWRRWIGKTWTSGVANIEE